MAILRILWELYFDDNNILDIQIKNEDYEIKIIDDEIKIEKKDQQN